MNDSACPGVLKYPSRPAITSWLLACDLDVSPRKWKQKWNMGTSDHIVTKRSGTLHHKKTFFASQTQPRGVGTRKSHILRSIKGKFPSCDSWHSWYIES